MVRALAGGCHCDSDCDCDGEEDLRITHLTLRKPLSAYLSTPAARALLAAVAQMLRRYVELSSKSWGSLNSGQGQCASSSATCMKFQIFEYCMEIVQVSNEISMLRRQLEVLNTVRLLDNRVVKGSGRVEAPVIQ
ncbi:hypothetical protein C8J57DRAFT_1510411 [Mycena rebaudengoi]|nr:hypothetical protein C8J57DRAFT_1510411 [Mycena rebaudengoi]